MLALFPSASVEPASAAVQALSLPDPNDRHVLATAIAGKADVLVTFNLKDFPPNVVGSHGIAVMHPDIFVCGLLNAHAGNVREALARQLAALVNPPVNEVELLAQLAKVGLSATSQRLQRLASQAH